MFPWRRLLCKPPPHTAIKTTLFIAVGALALSLYLWIWPGHHTPQHFVIEKGASARVIARDLKNARLIGSELAFRVWAKLLGAREAMHPGIYQMVPGWTGFRSYQQIRQGPPLVRVTFPEGWTSRQMATLLESKGIITSSMTFISIVEKDQREGFLFPDTYAFNQAIDPAAVISRMIHRFHEEEPKDILTQAKALKLSYKQIVILASLVEREARVPSERAVVAGVFYNRLRKHMHLESCATVEYALGAWKPSLTYKDLQTQSPYNTYLHAGLPPGPICNPGKASLEAAAHPAQTDMLFFFAEGNGTHHFSKTYQEHMAAQKQRKRP